MKKLGLALVGLAMAGVCPALADNTDTATVTVSGAIVAPLVATVDNGLTLPHIVKPKATLANAAASPSGGTSTLGYSCSAAGVGTIAYGPGANPFAGGVAAAATPAVGGSNAVLVGPATAAVTGTCAKLTVTGESGYAFLTTIGMPGAPAGGVTVTATNCSSTTAATVLAAGTATVYCGANISVSTAAVAGTFSNSFPVTVTYD
jgi:hypothetical protein